MYAVTEHIKIIYTMYRMFGGVKKAIFLRHAPDQNQLGGFVGRMRLMGGRILGCVRMNVRLR